MSKELSWLEFLSINEGSKPLNELIRDYEIYLLQQPSEPQYDYNFLLNYFLQHHKGGGSVTEDVVDDILEYLLQENGDFLLQENGDKIIL